MNNNASFKDMPHPDERYVFHGSWHPVDIAHPTKHMRMKKDANGRPQIIFNDISFHATPYRWIALAYIYKHHVIPETNGEKYFTMGVDLYNHHFVLDIYGTGSLEESLRILYGNGGYLMSFPKKYFSHVEGLGTLEVICTQKLKAETIEYIEDPVEEMKKYGINFRFTDILRS